MADEQTTTEVADNPTPETEQNSESVLGSGISDNQTETDWKSSLPEELRNEPTLQNLNDVESLAKESAMLAIREILPKINLDKPIPPEMLMDLQIKMNHFETALTSIEPSALREVLISQPTETWDDIGGLEDAILQLREVIEWPLKYQFHSFSSETGQSLQRSTQPVLYI